MQEADIVVTNPPFSLFKEYLPLLIKHKKKFIVLGNMNALSYNQIFPLFKGNQCWYGPSIFSGDRWFGVPEYYPLRGCLKKIDKIAYSIVLGVVSLYGSGKSGNFERNLVWLGLNSQF